MKNLAYRICCYFETVKKSFITLFDIELYDNKLVDGFSNPPFFISKQQPTWKMVEILDEKCNEHGMKVLEKSVIETTSSI